MYWVWIVFSKDMNIHFFRWPVVWGIWFFHLFLLYTLCCTNPWLMLMQDLVYYMLSWFIVWCDVEYSMWCTCYHDLSCYVLRSIVVFWWDIVVVIMHVLHWDPCYAMLTGCSSCMFLCHTDRSLLTESSNTGTYLIATPARGNFPCMIAASSLVYIMIINNT